MFDFPTAPARSASRRWTALASTGLHALLLLAVTTHRPAVQERVVQEPPDTFVWRIPQKHSVDDQGQPQRSNVPVAPRPAPAFRASDRFIGEIPPPDFSQPPLDPRSLTGPLGPGSVNPIRDGIGPVDSPDAPRDWRVVDEAPRLLTAGALEYPSSLKGMGLEGTVRLRFVVDTSGRAMPGTIEIISATHPLFIPAAKRTVMESRFEPGRVKGEAVRVMVEQTIRYSER